MRKGPARVLFLRPWLSQAGAGVAKNYITSPPKSQQEICEQIMNKLFFLKLKKRLTNQYLGLIMISRGEAKRSPPKPAVATEVVRGPDPQGAKVLSGFILKKPLPIGGYRSARQILARGPAPYKGVRLKSLTKQKRKQIKKGSKTLYFFSKNY